MNKQTDTSFGIDCNTMDFQDDEGGDFYENMSSINTSPQSVKNESRIKAATPISNY